MREANELAAPAWDYQDAWVSNPRVTEREQVHILGLEKGEDDESPLTNDKYDLADVFAANRLEKAKLRVVRTGQPDRVYLYKIEASIPAFVLRHIEMYEERYEQLSKIRCFHVDRKFETLDLSVRPRPSAAEVPRLWARARLLRVVTRNDNQGYVFEGERVNGEPRPLALGLTLAEAYRHVGKDFFLFRELERCVKKKAEDEQVWTANRERFLQSVRDAKEKAEAHLQSREQELAAAGGNGSRELELLRQDLEVVRKEIEAFEALEKELAEAQPVQQDYLA